MQKALVASAIESARDAEALGLPVYRQPIRGTAVVQSKEYRHVRGNGQHGHDETEDLFQLLQKVREDGASADVPFIMVTAESKTDNVVAARRAGVSHYIVKPFNAATLKSKTDAVFTSVAA